MTGITNTEEKNVPDCRALFKRGTGARQRAQALTKKRAKRKNEGGGAERGDRYEGGGEKVRVKTRGLHRKRSQAEGGAGKTWPEGHLWRWEIRGS